MAPKTRRSYKQPISIAITPTTPNPPTRGHALRYPDEDLWAKSMDPELDEVDENGTVNWLKPAELSIIPKGTKVINMTVGFNCK